MRKLISFVLFTSACGSAFVCVDREIPPWKCDDVAITCDADGNLRLYSGDCPAGGAADAMRAGYRVGWCLPGDPPPFGPIVTARCSENDLIVEGQGQGFAALVLWNMDEWCFPVEPEKVCSE
jgi:hypothetical protein